MESCFPLNLGHRHSPGHLQRTKIKPSRNEDSLSEFWQGTELDLHVEDVLKTPWVNGAVKSVELSHVKGFLDSKLNIIKLLRQCVATIQTVVLIDGIILRFKVQGPFGDANGISPARHSI